MDTRKDGKKLAHGKNVLFVATIDAHILSFHLPYLKMLQEKGYETHVVTNGKARIPYCDHHHTICIERNPFKVNNLRAIRQMQKLLKQQHFDIIHCHTPMGSVVTRLAAKEARKHGTRIIYTAHGFHFYKGAPLLNWLLFYPVEKYLAKYTDTLITINQEDYNRAKKKFSKRCRDIQYVPGVGLDTSKFDFKMTAKEKLEFRESLGLKKDDFVIIYPARIDKNKNHDFLIDVARELIPQYPNIHFIFPGQDELHHKCQDRVNNLGLDGNMHFLGFRPDIPKLLKISDLAVSTSKREGLPMNIVEAMYCDLPIVAINCRGTNDLVKNGKNGFTIMPKDSENFISKILLFYNNQNNGKKKKSNLSRKTDIPTSTHISSMLEPIYNQKKTVLHLLFSNKFSGAENVVCQIMEKSSGDFIMYYCSPHGDINRILKQKNLKKIDIDKITPAKIRELIKKYHVDIIHAHDFRASCTAALATIDMKRTVIISHLHQNPTWMRKINSRTVLYRICAPKFKKILLVSDSIKQQYIFSKPLKHKMFVVDNPMSCLRMPAPSRRTRSTTRKTFDICCLGRITDAKDPLRFASIISKLKAILPNIKVIWVGDGEMKDEFKKEIKRLDLEPSIELVGFQDNPYPFLEQSKIFLLTSKYEGFGLSAFEALSAGLPCVVSRVGGLVNIVDESCGKLCIPDKEFIDEVIKLLNNEKYFLQKHLSASRKAQKLDNSQKYMANITEIYHQCLI